METQSAGCARGLPSSLPAWARSLPYVCESTAAEAHFSNGQDPEPRARNVFAFHQPATLAEWLQQAAAGPAAAPATVLSTGTTPPPAEAQRPAATMPARLQAMPELVTASGDFKFRPARISAIRNLERSLAQNKPRAPIQMATGSGKTFTAISSIYRLIKFSGARRVLFQVDRGNPGRQTKKEFDQYVSPVNTTASGPR